MCFNTAIYYGVGTKFTMRAQDTTCRIKLLLGLTEWKYLLVINSFLMHLYDHTLGSLTKGLLNILLLPLWEDSNKNSTIVKQ